MSVYYLSTFARPNNNSGVVLKGASSNNILSNVPVTLNPDDLPFASTVVEGVNTDSALSLGNFAFDNQKPIVKGFTTSINGDSFSSSAAGVSSTGNADPALTSAIHPISTVRTRLSTTAERGGRFNHVTGKFDPGYPDVQTDDLGVDTAAVPSRENPGKLHYAHGKRLISTSYYPKNG